MKYSDSEIYRLNNVEMMLLELITENKGVSGYEINKLVEERGYRSWADIGTTAIYLGLEKLEKRDFVQSFLDTEKRGRGPVPRRFHITRQGKKALKDSIFTALQDCRERDKRFDLALAGLPLVDIQEVCTSLEKRKAMLRQSARMINNKFHEQGGDGLPLPARMVFRHPVFLIEHELRFTQSVIDELNKLKES